MEALGGRSFVAEGDDNDDDDDEEGTIRKTTKTLPVALNKEEATGRMSNLAAVTGNMQQNVAKHFKLNS